MVVSDYEPVFRKLAKELELEVGITYDEIVELWRQIYDQDTIAKAINDESPFLKFLKKE